MGTTFFPFLFDFLYYLVPNLRNVFWDRIIESIDHFLPFGSVSKVGICLVLIA